MLSHVTIGVSDVARALNFYSPLMAALGYPLKFAEPDICAAWKPLDADRPPVVILRPFDGGEASVGNGQMLALLAETRALVDRGYEIALRNGGRSEGAPGLRPKYHKNYYGAYFRDPDGNKLCVVCHEAAD